MNEPHLITVIGRSFKGESGLWKEFRKFISRGNVVDLAVAVIIGTAFGRIISSFVKDVLMPPIGMLLGGVDFTNLFVSLDGLHYESLAEAEAAGAATLNYGLFINTVIDFLIVALVIFIIIRQIAKAQERRKPAAAPSAPTTKACDFCFTEIPIKATRCPNCTSELSVQK